MRNFGSGRKTLALLKYNGTIEQPSTLIIKTISVDGYLYFTIKGI